MTNPLTDRQTPLTPNRIDLIRPDAPELAQRGPHAIGVQTLEFVHKAQVNVALSQPGVSHVYDRALTVEVWYPAVSSTQQSKGVYTVMTRDGVTSALLAGQAVRNAVPLRDGAAFPFVLISHGFPGNRFLLSHFAEHLASHGFVVASVDHVGSLYEDATLFASTLLHRPLDQLFVLNEITRLSMSSEHFLYQLVDTDHCGLIGYSMGGYGVLNVLGAGFSAQSVHFPMSPRNGELAIRQHGDPRYLATHDARIKAGIAIGPWGMNAGFWDADGLAGVRTPLLFMAGDQDDISGYETGVKAIFEGTINAERYLLTFEGANHNAAAPIPAPVETWSNKESFDHYADAVWDTVRMNNIAQHFAHAFFRLHLKHDAGARAYLELVPRAEDGVYRMDANNQPAPEHTYWRGFAERTAKKLRFERRAPA